MYQKWFRLLKVIITKTSFNWHFPPSPFLLPRYFLKKKTPVFKTFFILSLRDNLDIPKTTFGFNWSMLLPSTRNILSWKTVFHCEINELALSSVCYYCRSFEQTCCTDQYISCWNNNFFSRLTSTNNNSASVFFWIRELLANIC